MSAAFVWSMLALYDVCNSLGSSLPVPSPLQRLDLLPLQAKSTARWMGDLQSGRVVRHRLAILVDKEYLGWVLDSFLVCLFLCRHDLSHWKSSFRVGFDEGMHASVLYISEWRGYRSRHPPPTVPFVPSASEGSEDVVPDVDRMTLLVFDFCVLSSHGVVVGRVAYSQISLVRSEARKRMLPLELSLVLSRAGSEPIVVWGGEEGERAES